MPLFAAFFSTVIGAFASFFAAMASKKITVLLLATSAITVCSVALMVAFNVAVSPLVAAMFSTQFGQFLGLAFPPISGTCMASIGLMWAACAGYKMKVASIKMTASA